MSKYYNLKKLNPDENYHFILKSKKIDKILYDSYVSDCGIGKENYNYIMKFIKKQKQDIDLLKSITNEYNAFNGAIDKKIIIADDYYFNNGFFKNNFISKDKIREKIKKAKEINWHTPKLVIEYFEELLEEK